MGDGLTFTQNMAATQRYDEELEHIQTLNAQCLDIWKVISGHLNEEKTEFVFPQLQSLSFAFPYLSIFYGKNQISWKGFSELFSGGCNFFNDSLPREEYYDLSPIIRKYSVLYPDRAMTLLMEWKNTLQEVHSLLEGIHSRYEEYWSLLNTICEHFNIPTVKPDKDTLRRVRYSKKSLFSKQLGFSFTIDLSNSDEIISELIQLAYCVQRIYYFDSVVIEREDFVWSKCGENVVIDNLKTAKTSFAGYGDTAGGAVGSVGWDTGIHSWTVRLNGGHLLFGYGIYSIVVGVTTDSSKSDVVIGNEDTGLIGYCSFKDDDRYHFDKTFGHWKALSDNEHVTLHLDCEEGTLSYYTVPKDVPFFQLRVPKNVKLYPFVYLRDTGNSVTIVLE